MKMAEAILTLDDIFQCGFFKRRQFTQPMETGTLVASRVGEERDDSSNMYEDNSLLSDHRTAVQPIQLYLNQ